MYRLGTLSREPDALAVAQTAAQRPSAAMLDLFWLGSARKWSSEPLWNEKTALCSAILESPLPDSNRRPLPYHGGSIRRDSYDLQRLCVVSGSREFAHFAGFSQGRVPLVFLDCSPTSSRSPADMPPAAPGPRVSGKRSSRPGTWRESAAFAAAFTHSGFLLIS
jgi:hypothetical protein